MIKKVLMFTPKPEQLIFPRVSEHLPIEPKEIKPHPYGIEVGMLIKMIDSTEARTLQSFFTTEFARVGPGTAKEICNKASILPNFKPKDVTREQVSIDPDIDSILQFFCCYPVLCQGI